MFHRDTGTCTRLAIDLVIDLYKSFMAAFPSEICREMEEMTDHYLSLLPVLTSNICTMPAIDAVARYFPSVLNAARFTGNVGRCGSVRPSNRD